ncbi:hypothetical protein M758_UG259500 [Ceratodon purpureus]|nr:hypothetical protein M758_UG259500 [Ceratodon purpureus]
MTTSPHHLRTPTAPLHLLLLLPLIHFSEPLQVSLHCASSLTCPQHLPGFANDNIVNPDSANSLTLLTYRLHRLCPPAKR